jgi:hypothetical protein
MVNDTNLMDGKNIIIPFFITNEQEKQSYYKACLEKVNKGEQIGYIFNYPPPCSTPKPVVS